MENEVLMNKRHIEKIEDVKVKEKIKTKREKEILIQR